MKLSASHISFQTGPHCLLDDVSFSAPSGSITGIVGPNGAGKTTLLKLLAGLEKPAAGNIFLGNAALPDMKLQVRAGLVAYIPQTRVIHWPVSVRDLVSIARLPHRRISGGLSGNCLEIIDNAMVQMQVKHLAGRDATSLSGGEQARVLLARALAQTPRVLLADEPTAGLDVRHQISLMEKFQNLAASGLTIIVILHDLSQAARICDQLVMLNKGRIVCKGPPEDVLTKTTISEVYGVDVDIRRIKGRPVIMPLGISVGEDVA